MIRATLRWNGDESTMLRAHRGRHENTLRARRDMAVAVQIRPWTIEELDRLPDDGNKYEVVRGELFVTPPPSPDHEEILSRLTHLLVPFVSAQNLGAVYHPRSVIRLDGSEVGPDLMVRRPAPSKTPWVAWPIPILVIQAISPTTRRRDRNQKRAFYLDAGVDEYWIVDEEERSVRVVCAGEDDRDESETIVWSPRGASESLRIELGDLFD